LAGNVPPLYTDSETEILGVPATKENQMVDPDLGRFKSGFPADKAAIYQHSFKTTSVRNVEYTAPYMHNGVYNTLEEVIDFYNQGGGEGLGLAVFNQTLPPNALNLSKKEVKSLKAFMLSLSADLSKFQAPQELPAFEEAELKNRKVGGSVRFE